MKGRDLSEEDLGVDGRIILKWTLIICCVTNCLENYSLGPAETSKTNRLQASRCQKVKDYVSDF
jgi:hypothetical protein